MGKLAVGAYIATLRDAKPLTQKEAAERIGARLPGRKHLAVRMMTNYENGENIPGVEVLLAIFQVIGGNVADVSHLMLNDFEDEAAEGRAKALAWIDSQGKATNELSATADEVARIVAGLEARGEEDLAADYLNIGRRLLGGRPARRRASEGS